MAAGTYYNCVDTQQVEVYIDPTKTEDKDIELYYYPILGNNIPPSGITSLHIHEYDSEIINSNPNFQIDKNFKVIAICNENPDWVAVKNGDNQYGWINLNNYGDTFTYKNDKDQEKLAALRKQVGENCVDMVYSSEVKQEIADRIANDMAYVDIDAINARNSYPPSANGYSAPSSLPNETIVAYTSIDVAGDSLDDKYNGYLAMAVKAFGAPPQWTKYVDPRVNRITYGSTVDIMLGRKFTSTVLGAPTILSLAPGIIKYNEYFGKIAADAISDADAFEDNFDVESIGNKMIEFKPCWSGKVDNNYGYMEYVNLLNRLFAVAMARTYPNTSGIGSAEVPLDERNFPRTETPYTKFNWAPYTGGDNDSSYLFGLSGGATVSIGDAVEQLSEVKYVNFFCSGNNRTRENYETSVRSSSIEELVQSTLNSTLKEVMYFAGGTFGEGMQKDLDTWAENASATLGGLGNLLKNAAQLASGGNIEFPQIVDSCTFGRDASFTVRFVAGSADVESRYLMRCEFNHILALLLPRQLSTDINMYTIPFLVRAICPGRFSCDIGVLSGIDISYGGSNDNAWTINSQPTEIEITFSITPLYNKLYMTSSKQIGATLIKNTGLLEYIVSNSGVDMRTSALELKSAIIRAMAGGRLADIPNDVISVVENSKIVTAIRNFTSFYHVG